MELVEDHAFTDANADAGSCFGDDELARMLHRISELESNYEALVKHVSATVHPSLSTPPATDDNYASLPDPGVFRAPTALPVQLTNLGNSIARGHAAQLASLPQSRASSPPPHNATWAALPQGVALSLDAVDKDTRQSTLAALRTSVDVWFAQLDPVCACIDEKTFRPLFDKFARNQELTELSPADRLQWLALLNLMHAEVMILSDERSLWPQPAAWADFCRAEAILSRLTWLGNGNIMTVQCLLLKARYLLHAEKAHAAYDTMGRVARYCWQLGLLCQPSWVGLADEQIAVRQRIAWTAIALDREVALLAGAPYLIRQTDVALDSHRTDPFLSANALWAHLAADIWDTVYGVGAERPLSAEHLATIEARIRLKQRQFPEPLKWKSSMGSGGFPVQSNGDSNGDSDGHEPASLVRQRFVMFQRMNILRLLLRQERMESLDFDDAFARDCTEIASITVSATHEACHSPSYSVIDRFFAGLCLVTSLLPLICVIVKHDSTSTNRSNAIESYHKATAMMRTMEANFSPASHGLSRLHRLLRTTDRAIRRFHHDEQLSFDPSEFDVQTLIPQISGPFAPKNPPQYWDNDILDANVPGPFSPGPFSLGNDVNFGLTPGGNHLDSSINVTMM
jgi:hypothetical protein